VIAAPRGTHDVLPSDQPQWERVTGAAKRLCEAYGYQRIQTPGFEETELFLRTSGAASDIVRKEMYTFTDRGGRSLTLRPEGTAPIVRAYLEHGMHKEPPPVTLNTIAPLYRYAAPQRGRYREHWQVSVEAIGSADPAVDAELIQLYDRLLHELGVTGYRLELNSIGDRACRPAYIERLERWLDEHDGALDDDTREKRATSPLRVFDTKNPHVAEALQEAPKIGESLCADCAEHYAQVKRYLDRYGVAYEEVPTLVRGLDYYTRTTFEFVDEAIGAQSTICGGGRYDYLVEEVGGPPTAGIGFGAGIERLLISMDAPPPSPDRTQVFFVTHGIDEVLLVLPILARLRAEGISADLDYGRRSEKGQLTQAQRVGADTIVIVGADGFTVRRRGQRDVTVSDLSELEL
jgi:histidyl-tRNA synthetase